MYLWMQKDSDLKCKTRQVFIDTQVEQDSTVVCDGFMDIPA